MTLNFNEPIRFGSGGNAVGLNCKGIDFAEENRSWTIGPMAELDVQLPFARSDVVMRVEASPFLVPDLILVQHVFIFLGGLFVGFSRLKGHVVDEFAVNRASVSGRATRLALAIPTATSPHALGLSGDLRELGIYLTSITFKTAP